MAKNTESQEYNSIKWCDDKYTTISAIEPL